MHEHEEKLATIGCTVTTAIFSHMVAQATEESKIQDETPYRRTLKIGGELHPKYPGSIGAQMARFESEGHTVVQRGKRYFVENFAKKLSGTR
ncbi:hypothetical protein [Variovorax boronicumulans]|uniref:hypothetical protein n=1 Tax=Variovorax boronicumulans TaxID=436515 RepID=UPI003396A019